MSEPIVNRHTLGHGAPSAPDTKWFEEQPEFHAEMQALWEMGFMNMEQNVRVLLAAGGNVDSAVESLLNVGGSSHHKG